MNKEEREKENYSARNTHSHDGDIQYSYNHKKQVFFLSSTFYIKQREHYLYYLFYRTRNCTEVNAID
jgi:hypothetical protein